MPTGGEFVAASAASTLRPPHTLRRVDHQSLNIQDVDQLLLNIDFTMPREDPAPGDREAIMVDWTQMLCDAIEDDDVEVAREAIRHGADVNGAVGPEDETPLASAVHMNNLVLMKLLLESGADPNLPCDNFWKSPPLFWAWDIPRARLLVEFGASVRTECVSSERRRETSVHGAAQRGDADLLRFLLEHADGKRVVNQFDDLDFTPLHAAAVEGHLACMRLLMEAGADPNAIDIDFCGRTPLAAAVEEGVDDEVIQLLLDAGGDPALGVPCCGHSALEYARKRKRRPELLNLLERYTRRL